jgi:2-keto-4-pentenoate hydratase/2-oxohepta-3-ene-1,7-dioic acid hydratase in catechol pathway
MLADGIPRAGIVQDQAMVEVEGDFLSRYGATDKIHPLDEIAFLPPVVPSKIVCLGANFKDHAEEMDRPVPKEPKIFLKAPSALVGHRSSIRLPDVEGKIEHEAEIALVIGKQGRRIPQSQVLDYIFGFTCFNDITARLLQKRDGVYTRAKSFDTFGPTGPWLDTDVLWEDLVVEGWLNGELKQRAALAEAVFKVPEVLAFISSIMTLLPGDMVVMGTPAGVGPLVPDDIFRVVIEQIGTLENPVKADDSPREAS